jgi:beta-ribofuranosylaminobenzene 5'-phosphate synthase
MNGIKQRNKIIRISSFPRIHITLIGMNNDGYRINGSVGFSISAPIINLYFEVSENIEIDDRRKLKFTEQEKERLKQVISESISKLGFKKKIRCTIQSDALPHYGLGSNTAIYLSCIEALFILNDFKYNFEDVITLSKRGGTSGIGINTYFDGGYIFDVGIKNDEQVFNPSSVADRKGKAPLVVHKCELPNWKIGICIPTKISNKSEQEELEFFKTNCPINKTSIEKILYEAVYGITSSIIENDYDVFCKSVNAIQSTQWKDLERQLYGEDLTDLEKKIKSLGADCVGMSSLGPMLFFTGKEIEAIISELNNIDGIISYCSSFNNQGRIIHYD